MALAVVLGLAGLGAVLCGAELASRARRPASLAGALLCGAGLFALCAAIARAVRAW